MTCVNIIRNISSGVISEHEQPSVTLSGRSSTYILNRRGPSRDPCGTPYFTYFISVVYIMKRKTHGCLEIPDLFLALNTTFNTRNKSSISAGIVYCLYRNIV